MKTSVFPVLTMMLLQNFDISASNDAVNKATSRNVVPFQVEKGLEELSKLTNAEIQVRFLNGVSPKCQTDAFDVFSHFVNKTFPSDSLPLHVKSLIASWGTFSRETSNLDQASIAVGDFGQCIHLDSNSVLEGEYSGKYCLSVMQNGRNETVAAKAIVPFLFGSCVPSSCSKDDMFTFAQNILGVLNYSEVDFRVLDCFTKLEEDLGAWDIFMLCILGVLVLMTALSLLCNSERLERRRTFGSRFLASFSLKGNLSCWLKPREPEPFPAINGILFLSVAWIILANTWELPFLSYYFPEHNDMAPRVYHTDWSLLLITNGRIGIDTLFTITGIVVAYNVLKELDLMEGKDRLYFLYVQIFMRFTPVYLLVIGFIATIFRLLGDGPLGGLLHHTSANCASNGWKNILYVNNFGNATMENMCLQDSWYFAVEMQLYLFAPILLYVLWKYRKTGFGLLTLLILVSIAVPALVTYYRNMLPAMIPTRNHETYFTDFYILPWNRASPFLVGIVCGCSLRITGKNFELSKPLILASWILSTAVAILIIYGLFPYYDPNVKIPGAEAAAYAGFHRFAWGVVVSWITFACSRGMGGWIAKFLSWKFFGPLGRISMVAFLVALPVQFVHHFRIQPILNPDTYTKINLFIADLVITYFVAIVLTLILGLPSQHIGNFFKPRIEETRDDDLDGGMEMKPKAERNGIFYNSDISVCMDTSKRGNRRSSKNPNNYPRRERYGIFYENDVSISMERIK